MAIRFIRRFVTLRVRRLRASATQLGAGLVTGAADDDPSGIATYSQAGARFGLATLWTIWLTLPLMIGIQAVCARIGRVTGRGLAANMNRCFPRPLTLALVALLLAANVFNLAADLGAMGAAMRLLLRGSASFYVLLFACLSVALEVAIPFARYARLLKVLTLSLLAYAATTLVVRVPWNEALYRLIIPVWRYDHGYLLMVVAMFGTTISPYMFFWQAAQEVEEEEEAQEQPLLMRPAIAGSALHRIDMDTAIGMAYSNAIGFFVVLVAAVVLNSHGVYCIDDAAGAARALQPLAGRFAGILFALGILGTGLLAIPVLAGSGAYALSEVFRWSNGLDRRFGEAKLFYGLIISATLFGGLLGLTPMEPMRMLFWAAVLNGIISVPLMAAAMWLATRKEIMGPLVVRSWLRLLGWLATAVMAGVVLAMAFA